MNNPTKSFGKAIGAVLLAVAFVVGCDSSSNNASNDGAADNDVTTLRITLDAQQQVPVTASTATGNGTLSLNTTTRLLTGSVESTGVDTTVAHIHVGEAGNNGGVVVALEVDSNTASVPANTTLTEAQASAVLNGDYYINLHSEAHPGGEIRGQITPDGVQVLAFPLTGDGQVPALTVNGSGAGYVTLRDADQSVSVTVTSATQTPAAAAHLHKGYAGENGGVLIGLDADASESGRFQGSAELASADYAEVKRGGSYVNVHTQAYPGGELRGQLVPEGISVFSALLSGYQQVPPVMTAASGKGYVTLNTADNTVTAFVRTRDLHNATMVHIHEGAKGDNGGVIVGLMVNADDANVWEVRNASVSAENAELISTTKSYFNVHTAAYPAGEIRGQIEAGPYVFSPAQRVRARSAEFVRIFAENVGAKLAPLYTETATLTLPGQSTVTGRDAIAQAWQGGFTQGGLRAVRLTIDSVEMGVDAEQYIENGRYALDVETATGLTTLNSTYKVTWLVPADGRTALIQDDLINP